MYFIFVYIFCFVLDIAVAWQVAKAVRLTTQYKASFNSWIAFCWCLFLLITSQWLATGL